MKGHTDRVTDPVSLAHHNPSNHIIIMNTEAVHWQLQQWTHSNNTTMARWFQMRLLTYLVSPTTTTTTPTVCRVEILHHTGHKTGYFRDQLCSQSLQLVLTIQLNVKMTKAINTRRARWRKIIKSGT